MQIYLASSWKNAELVKRVKILLEADDDTSTGRYVFSFDQLPANLSEHNAVTIFNFPPVNRAFQEDKKWLDWAEGVLLILPAGKSAHLEAGYAKGQGKHLVIYQEDFPNGEFDVMYGFADLITEDINEVVEYFSQQEKIVNRDIKELRAVAIGPDRIEIVVGYGTNEELAAWYQVECNLSDKEWVDYKVSDFPLDKQLEWEDVGGMTLRKLVADCKQFPCIAGYED